MIWISTKTSHFNQQQTQHPHMALTPGLQPAPHWWEASVLTTAPSLLPVEGGKDER